jgi:hypothetical protein
LNNRPIRELLEVAVVLISWGAVFLGLQLVLMALTMEGCP